LAHFAQLNEENLVTQVIVVANQDTADKDGVENEAIGIAFCTNLLGGNWKQTSYNGNIRKNYAGIGYLDETTAQWEAPVAYPTDDKRYTWDEETTSWVEVAE